MSEEMLEFWKNMALGLKDEMVTRGDAIDDLATKVSELQEQVEEANELILSIYDSESWLTQKNVLDSMSYMTRFRLRKEEQP